MPRKSSEPRPFLWLTFTLFFVFVIQKMAATLRHEQDPTSGPVYLKIDMTSGHLGASDRYKYLKEMAFQYAFVLDQLAATGETCLEANR